MKNSDIKIHHIGYAVNDIDKSAAEFEVLGFKRENEVVEDKERKVKILLIKKDNVLIELVAPLSKDSPVYTILKKNGNTSYHICFSTGDIFKSIERLRRNKYLVLEKPNPALAFNGHLVSFLYQPQVGLIELVEKKDDEL